MQCRYREKYADDHRRKEVRAEHCDAYAERLLARLIFALPVKARREQVHHKAERADEPAEQNANANGQHREPDTAPGDEAKRQNTDGDKRHLHPATPARQNLSVQSWSASVMMQVRMVMVIT